MNGRLGVEAALVGGTFLPGDVEVSDGRIAAVGLSAPAGRGLAVPGFVDLQLNGFAGVDFLGADAEGYRRAGDALLRTGVTSYLPTLVTSPEEQLLPALRAIPEGGAGPRVLGAHLEGPFLSALRLGAHDASARRDPDPALLERLLEAGRVRRVTLAPELPGASVLIELLVGRGVAVSLGHSDATAPQANEAFDRGARSVTHLFNAMRPVLAREPGLAGAALARDDVIVTVVLDGVHLAPEIALVAWAAARGRLALVTDAIAGATLGNGTSRLGNLTVRIEGGVARGADGVLAGSVLTMIEAVRNLHELGASLEEAVGAATLVPAKLLGDPVAGRLAVGLPADVVVLNDRLEVERVLVGGRTSG